LKEGGINEAKQELYDGILRSILAEGRKTSSYIKLIKHCSIKAYCEMELELHAFLKPFTINEMCYKLHFLHLYHCGS
jgi:hypothetical protein